MRLDARERARVLAGARAEIRRAWRERHQRRFPRAPGARRLALDIDVAAEQATMIRAGQIAALVLGHEGREFFPALGKQFRRAVLVEPVDLAPTRGEHAAQHERLDPRGMRLRVEQRQRGAP